MQCSSKIYCETIIFLTLIQTIVFNLILLIFFCLLTFVPYEQKQNSSDFVLLKFCCNKKIIGFMPKIFTLTVTLPHIRSNFVCRFVVCVVFLQSKFIHSRKSNVFVCVACYMDTF